MTTVHYPASTPADRARETEQVIATVRATIAPAEQAQALRDLKRGADGEPQLDKAMLERAAEAITLRARVADLETALSRVIDAIASIPPLGERVASLVQIPRVRDHRCTHHLQCSFCGRSQKEAKVLIAGPTVYICESCAATAASISAEAVGGG